MSQVYGYTEIIGTSSKDFTDAVNNGLKAMKEAGKEIRWFEVVEQRGYASDSTMYYQATLKVGHHV